MKRFLTCALSGVFFIWLPNAFADDNGGLLADAPSHIRQAQGDHKVLLTLRADNIQVRAEWRVTSAVKVFDIHEGKLQTVTTIVAPVTHVATIYAVDRFDLLNASYANLTASAVITVLFLSETEELQLSDAPRLTAVAGKALSLHTFVATGGSEGKTYTLVAGGDGHFVLDEASGVLSLRADAEPDIYTLTVEARDDADDIDEAVATVEVSAALALSDAPPFTVIASVAMSLHTFVASGGIGALTYTILMANGGHFDLNAASGVLSLAAGAEPDTYVLRIQVKDARDNTAETVATVEVSAVLSLAAVSLLEAIEGKAMSLHMFSASGGIGSRTYTLAAGDEDYFSVDVGSGVLSLSMNAKAEKYTLTVQVVDARNNTAQAVATVAVSAALELAAASPFTVIASVAMSLHTFVADGGIGSRTYTLAAGDEDYFSVDASSGVLSLLADAEVGSHTLTVQVMDGRDNTAQAVALVEVSAVLALAEVPSFTVIASVAMSLHTFVADGGIGSRTYTLAAGDKDYFSVDASSGVLSLLADAEAGRHLLTVQVMDARDNTAETVATVGVSAVLALAEVPSFTVIASVAMSLHTFVASGGIGSRTYTLLAGDERYFSVGAGSGVLSLSMNAEVGRHLLTVQVMDARDNTAETVATVGVSAALSLLEVPSFTVIISAALSLHTFIASGGIGSKTYTLLAGDERYFSVGAGSGVLSLSMNAEAGRHLLTVQVMDARDNTAQAVATVGVSAVLALTEVPSFTVIASVAMSLHTFVASGGIGSRTYTLLAGDERYFSVGADSGVLSLSVDAAVGSHTLTVQVMDARDNTAQAVATVEVSAALALTDAPSFTVIISAAMSLHTFIASGGIGTPTYTIVSGNEKGGFTLNATSGVLSLQADAEPDNYVLRIQAMDGRDNTVETVVTVGVSAVLLLADAPRLGEDQGIEISLHTFAAQGGIGARTYTLLTDNVEDHFSLDAASGVLSLLASAPMGTYTLSVQVRDERGNVANALATVEVGLLFLSDALELYAIVGREVSLHTFDAKGVAGTLSYTITESNVNSYFNLDTKSGVLSVGADAPIGIYTLSVSVSDARSSAKALAVVEVRASLSLVAMPPLTVIVGRVAHTLAASGGIGTHTYTIVSGDEDGGFALDAASGALSLRADAALGQATLTLQVADARANTVQAVATVEVSAVLSLAEVSLLEAIAGNALSLHIFVADGGIGSRTYTLLAGDDEYFSVGAGSGVLSLSAGAAVGRHTLTVQVMDGRDNTAQAVATVGVSAVLALAAAPSFTVIASVGMSLHTFIASGGIGVKTYTLVADDDGKYFSVDTASGVLSLSVNAPIKKYMLTVQVMDERDNTAEGLAVVEVSAALSLASAPSFTVIAGVALSLHTFAASGGIGIRTYTLVSVKELGYFAVDAVGGALSLRADATVGVYTLTVQAMDEHDNTAEALAVVEVSAALSLAGAPPFTVAAGVALSLHTFAASGGIGIRTYTLVSGNELGYFAVDAVSGALSLLADAREGLYTLTVGVKDERDNTAEGVAVVEVSAVLSLAGAPSFTVIAGVALSLHTFAASGGIGIKTYTLVSGNELGYFAVDAASGALSMTEVATVGLYTLSVEVSDNAGNQTSVPVTVDVLPPLFVMDALSFSARVGQAVSLYTFSTTDRVAQTYILAAGNEEGYFSLDAGWVLSVSNKATVGVYQLLLEGSDSAGNQATAVVRVRIIRDGIFVLGGHKGNDVLNDVWSSAGGEVWVSVGVGGWSARNGHQAVVHQGRLYVLGGIDNSNSDRNDVWSLVISSWEKEDDADWSARSFHQAVSHNGRIYVLGGKSGSDALEGEDYYNDVWSSADGESWSLETAAADWLARSYHQAVSHNGRIYVLGGENGSDHYNDVWSSVDGKSWSLEIADGAGDWAGWHKAVSHNGRIYVLGGYGNGNNHDDVWSSVDGKNWRQEMVAGWPGRWGIQAMSYQGRLYVLGGYGDGGFNNDVWSLADGESWTLETADAGWSRRFNYQAVAFPPPLILLGTGSRFRLTVGLSSANIYTFQTQYGADNNTYSLSPAEVGFSIDHHGVLSADGNTPMGSYTLIVRVEDEIGTPTKAEVYVDVALSALPLLTDLAGKMIYTFTVGGGIGEKTYAIVAGNDAQYFTLGGASGKLSVRAEAEAGKYILQVKISDNRGDYAAGAITVKVLPPLSLAGVSLTSWARLSGVVTLHDFAVSSGVGTKGYALAAGNDAGYFALDEISGVLSLPVNPARLAGDYTLSVVVSDSAVPPYRVTAVAAVRLMKNAVMVLGGITDLEALSNDVWSSFDGRSWRQEKANNSAGWLARDRHQALLHNGRLYVLGGHDGTRRNDVWSSFDGRSWRQEKANNSAGWSPRVNHQAVSHNGRLYVLGGFDGGRKKDVWSSADGKSWTLETGSAGWSSRERHQAVSHHGRLYVLGGLDGSAQNDVWSSVDGKSWMLVTMNAAWSVRRDHQVVSHNERLYVLGGATGVGVRKNDVWSSVDGKSWQQEKADGAGGWGKRFNHQAVSYEGRLYVLGGFDGGRKNDVWSSADGRSWVEETAAGWSGRQDHQAVVLPPPLALPGVNPLRVVAGLQTPNIHTFAAQYGLLPYTYSLPPAVDGFRIDESHGVLSADGSALPGNYVLTVWVKDEEGARAQTEVHIEVATFDKVPLLFALVGRAEVIYTFNALEETKNHTYSLVAGNGDGYFSLGASGALSVTEEAAAGLYTLSVEISDAAGSQTSALVTVDVLPPLFVADFLSFTVRMGKAVSLYTFSTTDRVGAQTYILAGNDEGYFSLDAGWVLSVSSAATVGMYQLRLEGSDREGNQATAVVRVRIIRDGIFVLGGLFNVSIRLNDIWLSADGKSWMPEDDGDWSARNGHQAVVHQERLHVLGGLDDNGTRNDVWSQVNNSWMPAGNADWSARYYHQAVSHNERLYVLGGATSPDDDEFLNDVWWSADGTSWSQETATAGWSARREHQAVSHQGRLYVLGGIASNGTRNDVWSSVDGKSWRQETAMAGWSKRARHQAVSHQGRLYVLGGFDSGFRNDVWSSVDGKSWRQETAAEAWAGRYYHQAVSYNGRLYVLGGLEFGVGGRNNVWSSADGTSWSREADASWSGRQEHQAVVFPQSLVLLGASTRFRLTVGLPSSNIYTFQARYGTGNYTYSLLPAEAGFSIENHGVLSADGNTPMGSYTLTAQVEDETGSLAQIALPVDVALPELPLLTALAGKMIYTLTVGGGIGEKTYAIEEGDGAQYFTLGGASGKLSVRAEAEAGKYTLQVKISDSRGDYAAGPVTVEVLPPLSLAGVSLTGWARLSVAVTLHDFAVSSGVGTKGYTLVAGNDAGYFALDEISGVLSLLVNQGRLAGDYTLSLAVSDSDEPPSRVTAMVKVRLEKNGIFVLGGNESQTDSNDLQNDVWSSADGKSWREETAEAWPARWDHQVVPHRGRLYVLGGHDGSQRLNDVWSSADGKSWTEETAAAAWSARWDHQVVPHRGRLYVLGGDEGSDSLNDAWLNDVWSSADGKSWTEETAAAAWPERSAHRVVSHRGRLYVLGGYDGSKKLNDVWSSADGKSWREETAAAAWTVRAAHQAVSHRGRLYVLGGEDDNQRLNDVWSSADGKSWREETAGAWPARFYHQAVSRDGLLYVLGGEDADKRRLNDVWSSADGKSWTEETAAAWSARVGHQAVVFPSPLVLFGVGERLRLTVGLSSSNVATFQAHYGVGEYTYLLSPAAVGFSIDNYGVLSADGNTPMGSYTLTVWVDDEEGSSAQTALPVEVALPALPLLTAFAGKMIYTLTVSGGIGEKTYAIADGDGAQYFTLGVSSGKLSVRAEAEAGKYTLQVKISDSRGDYAAGAIAVEVLPPLSLAGVLLTGWARLSVAVTLHDFAVSSGVGTKGYTLVAGNDAGYFALDEISGVLSLLVNQGRLAGDYTLSLAVSDSDEPPNRATAMVMVRLAKNGIFVLGGDVGGSYSNDVWWAVGGKNWRQEQENNEAGRWSARRYHQAVSYQGRLYVLGGSDGDYRNDVWSSADGKSWRQDKASDEQGWSRRFRHQAVRHQGLLYVLGGYDGGYRNDVWSSADGVSWTEETSAAAWPARSNSQAVSHQGRLYVLGGYDGDYYNDVWSSVDGKSWTAEAAAAWPARSALQAVSHQGRLYVLGGYDGGYRNDVWSSADGETWRREKANDGQGWPGRFRHQVVSRDGLLYVLGGAIGTFLRNDVWSSADGRSWTKVADAAWSIRRGHQAVVFPSPLVLFGVGERIRLTVGMSSSNVAAFQAHYGGGAYTYSLSPAAVGFSIDNHGVLSADGNTPMGSYTLTVWVEDEEGSSAQTELPVEVTLAELPLLTAFAGKIIYTFTVGGGIGEKTYVIEEGDGAQYFTLGGASGKLSTRAEAEVGKYTLQVKISDSRGDYAAGAIAVEVVPPLSLAGVSLTSWARLSVAVTLHGFVVSSGVGAKRYTFVAGNDAGYFALDEISGVLSLPVNRARLAGDYTLSLVVSDSDKLPNRVTVVVQVRLVKNGIFMLGGNDGTRRNDVWWSADGKSWTEEAAAAWPARSRHQAVVHNGRLYVLGGTPNGSTRYNDVWSSADGKSWREETAAAAWPARYSHQVVSHRGRLYVLGGYSSERLGDVWSSADGKSWTEETAAAWSARTYHQAVSYRGRLYVLGGYDGTRRNDVWWSADGKSWTEETAAAWPARSSHQAVVHNGRLYVLGGDDGNSLNDVWWSADGKSWREETAATWPARSSHQAVVHNGRLYVLGGLGYDYRNDVWWSADGKSWREETAAAWTTRQEHQAVVFPSPLALSGGDERLRLTVGMSSFNVATFQAHYGGGAYTYSLSPAEVGFSIDNHGVLSADGNTPMGSYTLTVRVEDEEGSSAQTELPVEVALPALPLLTIFAGKMIYTLTVGGGIGEKIYAIAEGDGTQYFTLGGASGKLSVRAEAEAGKYTLQVKISDSRGDYAAGAITVEVLLTLSLAEMSLIGWARLSVAVTLHDFAVSSGVGAKRYTLVAGDDAGYFVLDEISGVLSLPVNQGMLAGDYTLSLVVSDSDEPPSRVTAMVKVRLAKNGIFVLGGYDGTRRNDAWSSADGKSWREETAAAAWPARYNYQAVAHNGRLYVLGGHDDAKLDDVWSSADGKSWREETAAAAWPARHRHQAVSHNGRLYVLGGHDGGRRNDVWSSADGKSWREETAAAAWPARHRHQAVSHNGRLYVLGGFAGSVQNDVWSSVDGKSWRQETAAAWPARRSHQAVSHNGRLYVLGGYDKKRLDDVWSSADGKSWREETAEAAWPARYKHQAVSRDGRLYVLGGLGGGYRNDVWWSADGKSWTEDTAAADWSGRDAYQAVVFPSPLALLGAGEMLRLTVGMSSSNLATFQAQYGVGAYTYSLTSEVSGFSIDESSGVLSVDGSVAVGRYTLTLWVEDEEGSQAQTAVDVDVIAASTAAWSAVGRFAWSGSDGSHNDVGLSEHGDSGRREGLRRFQQAMRYQTYVLGGG